MTPSKPDQYFVYVGAARGEGEPEGIYIYTMDMSSGALSPVGSVTDIHNPSFLAVHPDGQVVYAIDEDRNRTPLEAKVAAFRVDSQTGLLTRINEQVTQGQGLAHLSVDRDGRFLFATHYMGGSVSVLRIEDDGSLGKLTHVVQHEGRGDHPRQETAHPHSAFMDPTNRFVLVPDLGLDKVMIYELDSAQGTLKPHDPPWAEVAPASGPRHLAFHPNGRYVYVINELASTITAFGYEADTGRFVTLQTITTLPEGYADADANTTAEILVHPSGRFVYGSNRGHDSIAIFAVAGDGTLTALGHESTQGGHPRNFAMDPEGTYLYAENRDSNNIVTFRIDTDSGLLQSTGHVTEVPRPVCIKMIAKR